MGAINWKYLIHLRNYVSDIFVVMSLELLKPPEQKKKEYRKIF